MSILQKKNRQGKVKVIEIKDSGDENESSDMPSDAPKLKKQCVTVRTEEEEEEEE